MDSHLGRMISLLLRKSSWSEDERKRVLLITDEPFETLEEGKHQLQLFITKKNKLVKKSFSLDDWIVCKKTLRHQSLLNEWTNSLDDEDQIVSSMTGDTQVLRAVKFFLKDSGYPIYKDLHQFISTNQNFVALIDAPPGSGKTGFLRLFGMSLAEPKNKILCANANNVITSMSRVGDCDLKPPILANFTICKILQIGFSLTFLESINIFKDDTLSKTTGKLTDAEEMYKYYSLIFKYTWCLHGPQSILILDEYTLTAPALIYVFLVLARKYRFSLLFTGDSKQITAIDKNRFHAKSNFELLKHYAIVYTLTGQKRMVPEYYALFAEIQKIMNDFGTSKIIPFDFKFKYATFKSFYPAYFGKPNYDSLFFAATHKVITDRIDTHTDILKRNNLATIDSYFNVYDHEMSDEEDMFRELKPTPQQRNQRKYNKYLLRVPLTLNRFYWYHPVQTPRAPIVVKLLDFNNSHCTVVTLDGKARFALRKVRYINNMLTKEYVSTLIDMAIEQEILTMQTVTERRERVFENFPLTPLCSTFHNAQGCTLENITIDVDLDVKTTNEMYMVLSRIKEEKQLNYIKTKDLISLAITYYYHQTSGTLTNYYKLYQCDNEVTSEITKHIHRTLQGQPIVKSIVLDSLQFKPLRNVTEFERTNVNSVIPIYCYKPYGDSSKTKLTLWYDYTIERFDQFYSTELSKGGFMEKFKQWQQRN